MSDSTRFRAMVVSENEDKTFSRAISERTADDLPDGDLLVSVAYSSLNYKDALSASGNKGVTRNFPHTPGIDAAGTVVESGAGDFAAGDEVVLTGFDLGANTDGGFAEYVRVPAAWAVKRPDGLSLKESMVYGTAGFTAALSVLRLQEGGVTPDSGDVLVTGATGGVGCLAVGILAHAGYRVVASTGKESEKDFLMGLGAADVISREAADDQSGRPLLKSVWAGAVDTVGGNILATAIKSAKYGGVVTCCGNVASVDLPTSPSSPSSSGTCASSAWPRRTAPRASAPPCGRRWLASGSCPTWTPSPSTARWTSWTPTSKASSRAGSAAAWWWTFRADARGVPGPGVWQGMFTRPATPLGRGSLNKEVSCGAVLLGARSCAVSRGLQRRRIRASHGGPQFHAVPYGPATAQFLRF